MIEVNSFFQIQPIYDYLRKQRENQRFLKSLEIGTTFLLISLFLFFAIKPTVSTISSLVGEIKSKEILKQQMHDKINNIIQAQDSYLQAQDKYQLIESSLPSRPEYNQVNTQLRSAAIKSGANIQNINYNISEKNENNQDFVSYKVSFSTQGGFLQNISTLEKIQNSRRLMNIESVNYSKNTTNKNLDTNIDTKIFYLKQ